MSLSRLFFFALIPIGAVVLILAIRLVKKSMAGKVLLEIPYLQKTGTFEIAEPGVYSIWQKGPLFRKLPVYQFRPVIRDLASGENISLFPSIFRPNSNDGISCKMELFRFTAGRGRYQMDLKEGSSISGIEKAISHLFPVKKADPEKYYILVRESQPFYFVIAGILLMAFSGFMMIGGLVLGILDFKIS